MMKSAARIRNKTSFIRSDINEALLSPKLKDTFKINIHKYKHQDSSKMRQMVRRKNKLVKLIQDSSDESVDRVLAFRKKSKINDNNVKVIKSERNIGNGKTRTPGDVMQQNHIKNNINYAEDEGRSNDNNATVVNDGTTTHKNYPPLYFGLHLRPILRWWNRLAQRNNITYFLGAGSLFAAFLHGDLLEDDSDLDVLVDHRHLIFLESLESERNFTHFTFDHKFRIVMQPDWRQSIESRRRRRKCDGGWVESLLDSCSFQEPVARIIYNMLYLDVFSYTLKRNDVADLIDGHRINRQSVFPLRRCRLTGIDTYCPRQMKLFLIVHYGEEKFDGLYKQFKDRKPMIDWERFEVPTNEYENPKR